MIKTLMDLLNYAKQQPHNGVVFADSNEQQQDMSYRELYHCAQKGAGFLQSNGLVKGDRLLMQIEDNQNFLLVFWSCIAAGVVPVPVSVGKNEAHCAKTIQVWKQLKNAKIIFDSSTNQKLVENIESIFGKEKASEFAKDSLHCSALALYSEVGEIHTPRPEDVAFLQFSSGSTGSPKGVVLTHANLVSNLVGIAEVGNYVSKDVFLSWMPLTHDMGLIGFHLNPMLVGAKQIIMPTARFIRRPALWMQFATNHAATVLCSPNFGYRYLLKFISEDKQENWDLQKVRIIYNGAEPISNTLTEEFSVKMRSYGLPLNVIRPVYGLAEASLAVSMTPVGEPVQSIHLNRQFLGCEAEIIVERQSEKTATFVNVGTPISCCSIQIRGNKNQLLEDERIGQVWIAGNSVTQGYFENPEANISTIDKDGWLKTGDLGFVQNGALYITGRAKEVLLVNGQNFYAHDLERVAEQLSEIELNKIVIAGCFDATIESEIQMAFVFHRGKIEGFLPIQKRLKQHIMEKTGVTLDKVIPVKDIPRTTSGKLQRFELVKQFQNGEMNAVLSELELALTQENSKLNNGTEPKAPYAVVLPICQKVLDYSGLHWHSNFLEAGANSLRAAEICMLLSKHFNIAIEVALVYHCKTPYLLAKSIEEQDFEVLDSIPDTDNSEVFLPSSAQKRLFYLWHNDPKSIAYNVPIALQILGEVEGAKLEHALAKCVELFDALQFTFHNIESPEIHFNKTEEITLLQRKQVGNNWKENITQWILPFDLEKGPLFRFQLLTASNGTSILLLDFHHSIADGISVSNFIAALFSFYQGNSVSKPTSVATFGKYEQLQMAKKAKVEASKRYWEKQMHAPDFILPTNHSRPKIRTFKGGKHFFAIEESIQTQLLRFLKKEKISFAPFCTALFAVFLSKVAQQKEVAFGLPVANRMHPDYLHAFGMFVNNAIINLNVDSEQSFISFLRQTNAQQIEQIEHQYYPFEHIKSIASVKRDGTRNEGFDAMLVVQNMKFPNIDSEQIQVERALIDPKIAKYDLTLEVTESTDLLIFAWEYASNLFSNATIASFERHLTTLLNETLENPDKSLGALSTIDEVSFKELVLEFNDTEAVGHGETPGIVSQFEYWATKKKNQVCVYQNDVAYTYATLHQMSDSVAGFIASITQNNQNRIAVVMPHSIHCIAIILGVLKSGNTFVPIAEDLPKNRIKFLLEDSGAVLAFTNETHWLNTEESTPCTVYSGTIPSQFHDAKWKDNRVKDQETYVLYTSGTSGTPKGVVIQDKALLNYCNWAKEAYSLNENDVFAFFTSISFDLTLTSIFVPLLNGMALEVFQEQEADTLLKNVFRSSLITVAKLTPAHLRLVSHKEEVEKSNLKKCIVGGEALEVVLATKISSFFDHSIEIYNEYGPTEATIGCMVHKFNLDDSGTQVPIGKPADNMQVFLLDDNQRPIGRVGTGKLYISGVGLAKEYHGQPQLTKEKFLPHFKEQGARMYDTGDLAKWNEKKELVYCGRQDAQVKIKGHRIELKEIEHHFNALLPDKSGVVRVKKNLQDRDCICAYYLSGTSKEELAWRTYFADFLPHYMIPSHFIALDQFPLTANGKLDEAALPEPKEQGVLIESTLSEIEEVLIDVWETTLGVDNIGVQDNFFDLGGDSIQSVQIASKVFNQGYSLDSKTILTYQTIAMIAPQVGSIARGVEPISQQSLVGEKDMLPIEEWFFALPLSHPSFYNQSIVLELELSSQAIEFNAVFDRLIAHHDTLCLNYNPNKGGLFYNPLHREKPFEIAFFNANQEQDFQNIGMQLKSGKDLAKDLLFSAGHIAYQGKEYLLLTAHHLLVDGVSWRVLLEDMASLMQDIQVDLPLKTLSSGDYKRALLQKKTDSFENELPYWRDMEGLTPLWTAPDPQVSASLISVKGALNRVESETLRQKSREIINSGVEIALNTALGLCIEEVTGHNVIPVEQEFHGRDIEVGNIGRTVGWFTALYPTCIPVNPDAILESITRVKESLGKVPNNGLGYGILKQKGELTNALKYQSIRFNFLGQFDQSMHNEWFNWVNLDSGPDSHPENAASAAIELNCWYKSGALEWEFRFDENNLSNTLSSTIAEAFKTALHRILETLKEQNEIQHTPSDFDADLSQEDLEALFS